MHLLIAPAPAGHQGTRVPLPEPALNRRVVLRGTTAPAEPDVALFWDNLQVPVPAVPDNGLFWDTYR